MSLHEDTIIAPATPQGVSALAIIRLSGPQSIALTDTFFRGRPLRDQPGRSLHYGTLAQGERILDEVVIALYRAPHSFTREDAIEITCHGSPLIVKEIIQAFLLAGARLARPGEFTQRAFLNGRFDLAQAEAIADLIEADTENSRQAALNQMRGGFSKEIATLRDELIHFASLIELELDFGEEDVEFAKRPELRELVARILNVVTHLMQSFDQGRVIKDGIPTVIAGRPNAGKSTLLNALVNEERAIVSDIPGTTRDVIEDEVVLGGLRFRFMDTAGLRETADHVEALGIARTRASLKKASLIIYLLDLKNGDADGLDTEWQQLQQEKVPVLLVGNKLDEANPRAQAWAEARGALLISASNRTGVDALKQAIINRFAVPDIHPGDVVVTNLRHYQQLQLTREALQRVLDGLNGQLTGDLLAQDIRQALYYLGEITGAITTEDLLDNIFSKFCIGK